MENRGIVARYARALALLDQMVRSCAHDIRCEFHGCTCGAVAEMAITRAEALRFLRGKDESE